MAKDNRSLSMMLAIPSRSGGRARRTKAAVEDVFMATWMGELMGNSPTASSVVVMIAGARFHARTASQDSSRAPRPGRERALTRASLSSRY